MTSQETLPHQELGWKHFLWNSKSSVLSWNIASSRAVAAVLHVDSGGVQWDQVSDTGCGSLALRSQCNKDQWYLTPDTCWCYTSSTTSSSSICSNYCKYRTVIVSRNSQWNIIKKSHFGCRDPKLTWCKYYFIIIYHIFVWNVITLVFVLLQFIDKEKLQIQPVSFLLKF